MRRSLNEQIEISLSKVMERFLLLHTDAETVVEIIRNGLGFMGSNNIDEKIKLFNSTLSLFSEELLEAMVSGGTEYSPTATAWIWQRLVQNNLVIPALGHRRALVDHILLRDALFSHVADDTFVNLFAPPSALIERYANSIVAIDVTKNGINHRGSGFIVHVADGPALIVTCRHNVDPSHCIIDSITTAAGNILRHESPFLSANHDLATLVIREPVTWPFFRFGREVRVFDDVYTLGYPGVPGALPALTGHRGEVNGHTTLYIDRQSPVILISNLVSPGSSGSPVLTRDGHCIGMTIRWLEGEWDGEKARFSAALPVDVLKAFAGFR